MGEWHARVGVKLWPLHNSALILPSPSSPFNIVVQRMAAAAAQVEQARAVASEGFERRLREWSERLSRERRDEVMRVSRHVAIPERRGQLDRIIRGGNDPASGRTGATIGESTALQPAQTRSELEMLRGRSLVSTHISPGSSFRESIERFLGAPSSGGRPPHQQRGTHRQQQAHHHRHNSRRGAAEGAIGADERPPATQRPSRTWPSSSTNNDNDTLEQDPRHSTHNQSTTRALAHSHSNAASNGEPVRPTSHNEDYGDDDSQDEDALPYFDEFDHVDDRDTLARLARQRWSTIHTHTHTHTHTFAHTNLNKHRVATPTGLLMRIQATALLLLISRGPQQFIFSEACLHHAILALNATQTSHSLSRHTANSI